MKKALSISLAAGAAMFATPAMAQFSITPGGLNAGDGNYANGTPATSATGSGVANAAFRPTTTISPDNLFGNAWWFRGPNDTREYTFGTTAIAPLTITSATVGNNLNTLDTGGYDHTVTSANGYSFTAQLRWQISAGAFGPVVNYSAVVNNTGVSQLDLALVNYADFDVNGTAGTDTYSINGAGNMFSISDGPTEIAYSAINPDAYQATAFATLRGLLSNTAINNLDNTVAGSPGDFTGGFQWNLSIPVGGSATVAGSFAFVPTPSSMALLGLGGLIAARRRR